MRKYTHTHTFTRSHSLCLYRFLSSLSVSVSHSHLLSLKTFMLTYEIPLLSSILLYSTLITLSRFLFSRVHFRNQQSNNYSLRVLLPHSRSLRSHYFLTITTTSHFSLCTNTFHVSLSHKQQSLSLSLSLSFGDPSIGRKTLSLLLKRNSIHSKEIF